LNQWASAVPGQTILPGVGKAIKVIRTEAEIDEIRDAWAAWNYHPNSDIDFYLLLMKCSPGIERPHIIVLYRNGEPESMLIGRIVRQRIDLKIGYKSVISPKAVLLSFIYGGMLGDFSPENSRLVVESIVDSLRRGEADLASLGYVKTDSPLHNCAERVPRSLSRDFLSAAQPHWQTTLTGGAVRVFQGSAKDFRELRRKGRKFHEDYPNQIRIGRFGTLSDLDRMVADIEEVAKGTYQRGLGAGFADNDQRRRLLRFQAERGWLRAYILYVAEKPCAFWLGVVYRGVFYGGSLGYSQKYGKYAPGKYLMMKGIDDLCQDGIGTLDFGFGDAQYKRSLADGGWAEASPYIFAPSLNGLRLNLLRTSVGLLDKIGRGTVERAGLIPKVKRAWRHVLKPTVE
jgi:hypothetical protein